MQIYKYLCLLLVTLGSIETAVAANLQFTPTIIPSPIQLHCRASAEATDTRDVPVIKIYKNKKVKSITGEMIRMTETMMRKLKNDGYSQAGPLKEKNGRTYRVMKKLIRAEASLGMTLNLKIKANRSGAVVYIANGSMHKPTFKNNSTEASLEKRREITNEINRKSSEYASQLKELGNYIDGYEISYSQKEYGAFDVATAGYIKRIIPVSYCKKKRKFHVYIRWVKSFNLPKGDLGGDW